MKVQVDFTVDIDATAWINNYGCGAHEVREDVQGYVKYIVVSQLAKMDALTEEIDCSCVELEYSPIPDPACPLHGEGETNDP